MKCDYKYYQHYSDIKSIKPIFINIIDSSTNIKRKKLNLIDVMDT